MNADTGKIIRFKSKKEELCLTPVLFFLFASPLSVCSIVFPLGEPIVLALSFISMFLCSNYIFQINTYVKRILLLFYFPMLIAAAFAGIQLILKSDLHYSQYFMNYLPVRLIRISMLLCIFIFIHNFILHNKYALDRILKTYLAGIVCILGLFAIWQILSGFTGLWCPEIETRDSAYFLKGLGIKRVTSLADEPSYLVPFLIDALLISLFLGWRKIAIILTVIVLLSLSFGGFMELSMLALFYIFLASSKDKIKILSISIFLLLILLLFFPQVVDILIEIVSARAELQSDFNPNDTARTAMIIHPLKSLFNDNILAVLFGNGPSSFKYLYDSDSDCLFVTSNNIYADLMYEGGLISFISLVVLFYFMWNQFSHKNFVLDKRLIASKLFVVHVLLSSFYRADYASERFVVLFIIIEIFYLIIRNDTSLNQIYQKDNHDGSRI